MDNNITNTVENSLPKRRKQSHYFEIYLNKMLKTTLPKYSLSTNTKQQLSSYICFFIYFITKKLCHLTQLSKKKTISVKEMISIFKIILSGELLTNSINEGNKALTHFKTTDIKGISKQTKSGIVFPPSLVERLIRQKCFNHLILSYKVPIFLASICEYLCFEILDLATFHTSSEKRLRITVKDIQNAIETDEELSKLYHKVNFSFLGGGVIVQHYFHNLTNGTKKKKKIATLRIKNEQKGSEKTVFHKAPFNKLIRLIFFENNNKIEKISKQSFTILQLYIEQYIVKLLHKSYYLTMHAGRKKLVPNDILLTNYLINHDKNPYTKEENEENDNFQLFQITELGS